MRHFENTDSPRARSARFPNRNALLLARLAAAVEADNQAAIARLTDILARANGLPLESITITITPRER